MNRQNLDRLIAYVRQNQHFDMSVWSTLDLSRADGEHCGSPCCLGGTCTYLLEGQILAARLYPEIWSAATQYHSPGYLHHTGSTAAFLEIDHATASKLCDPEGDATYEEDEDGEEYTYHWPWDHLGGGDSNDSVTPEEAITALEKVWTRSQLVGEVA